MGYITINNKSIEYVNKDNNLFFKSKDIRKYLNLEKGFSKSIVENNKIKIDNKVFISYDEIIKFNNNDLNNEISKINNNIFDITKLEFNNKKIKIIMDENNNPWFKGKDIANILEYENSKKAISNNIDNDDKIIYKNLKMCRNIKGAFEMPPFESQPNAVFINESGLYSLILSSKKQESKLFKKWVTKDVLPNIRKYGEYKLNKELEIKENKIKELQNNNLQLKKIINNNNNFIINQIIYIATTNTYLKQNYFKVGGTLSKSKLKNRLSTYNTGRPDEDKYFYVFIKECNNYKLIEELIENLLETYKPNNNKEMYNINYKYLEKYINLIINNDNNIKELINNERELINNCCNEIFNLEPLEIKQTLTTKILKENKVILKEKKDLNIEDYIKKYINECIIINNNSKIQSSILYDNYKEWCIKNDINYVSQTKFSLDLKNKEYIVKRISGVVYFINISFGDT